MEITYMVLNNDKLVNDIVCQVDKDIQGFKNKKLIISNLMEPSKLFATLHELQVAYYLKSFSEYSDIEYEAVLPNQRNGSRTADWVVRKNGEPIVYVEVFTINDDFPFKQSKKIKTKLEKQIYDKQNGKLSKIPKDKDVGLILCGVKMFGTKNLDIDSDYDFINNDKRFKKMIHRIPLVILMGYKSPTEYNIKTITNESFK